MKLEGSYIQYAAGYDKDNISFSDIEKALQDLVKMDDEHGAFWVGVYGSNTDEIVLEIHKNLNLFGNFGEYGNFKIQILSLDVAKEFFELLLMGEINQLKEKLKNY